MNDPRLAPFRFHHVGLVTPDALAASALYRDLGYETSEVFVDPIQQASIVLCTTPDGPMVELIAPAGAGSPAAGWLKRLRAGAYHTCYEVVSIDEATPALRERDFAALGHPAPAVAFEGRRVLFFWSALAGLVELVESRPA